MSLPILLTAVADARTSFAPKTKPDAGTAAAGFADIVRRLDEEATAAELGTLMPDAGMSSRPTDAGAAGPAPDGSPALLKAPDAEPAPPSDGPVRTTDDIEHAAEEAVVEQARGAAPASPAPTGVTAEGSTPAADGAVPAVQGSTPASEGPSPVAPEPTAATAATIPATAAPIPAIPTAQDRATVTAVPAPARPAPAPVTPADTPATRAPDAVAPASDVRLHAPDVRIPEPGPAAHASRPEVGDPSAGVTPLTEARPIAASAAPPPPTTTRPALLPQLSGPVVALAQSADGEHSVTLTISPESLGPVTVRAHIAGDSIRLELHAPSDAGREALRLILSDLRRDLAIAAPGAALSVSSQDSAPGSTPEGRPDTGARADADGRNGSHSDPANGRRLSASATAQPSRLPSPTPDPQLSSSQLDVYA